MENYIPPTEFENRVKRTQEVMKQRKLDALLIFSGYEHKEANICYLTNHHITIFPAWGRAGGFSALILSADDAPTLIAGCILYEKPVIGVKDMITVSKISDHPKAILKVIKDEHLEQAHIGLVGSDIVPVSLWQPITQALQKAKIELADDILDSQMMIKSNNELNILKESAKLADIGLEAAIEVGKEGVREVDVAAAAFKASMEAGADHVARWVFKSSKQDVSIKWPLVTNRRIEKGEILGLDYVGWHKNYCWDEIRRWVAGTPNLKQKEILDYAVELCNTVIKSMKPGVTCGELANIAIQYGEEIGYKVRPSGHGIGINCTMKPRIELGDKTVLEPNMVLCQESAIIPNPEVASSWINIEEMVVVTKTGAEVITKCPRILW